MAPLGKMVAKACLFILLAGAILGCTPPQPTSLICLLDSSSSSALYRPQAIKTIKKIVVVLDRNIDKVSVFRMSEGVYSLYQGIPESRSLIQVLDLYSKVSEKEHGTAYGKALLFGLEQAKSDQKNGYRVALLIFGDGADERIAGTGNITWSTLPERFKEFPDPGLVAFLFTEPKWGEQYRVGLGPVLGERLLIIPPEMSNRNIGIRQIRAFLGR